LNDALPGAQKVDYQAQDFWVHLFTSTSPTTATRRNLPLGELATFFEQGATTKAVADTLRDSSRLLSESLGSEYWAWAKNQAYEKADVTFAHATSEPSQVLHCRCEPQLTSPALLRSPLPTFTYGDASNYEGAIPGTLESAMVRIHFPSAVRNVVVVVDGDVALRHEVYLGRPGSGTGDLASCDDIDDCSSLPSETEVETHLSVEAGSDVYVLLANSSEKIAPLKYNVRAYEPE
jgi:hypothetical protein